MEILAGRVIVWFSCGAASSLAAYLVLEKYRAMGLEERVHIVYCDTLDSEHEDNRRYIKDIEGWLERKIEVIKSEEYRDIDEVFMRTKYMSGIYGARCTTEMKKVPRLKYQKEGDIHVFGYTLDEWRRIEDFEDRNPELVCEWILKDQWITKEMCYIKLENAGIRLPEMYSLGFEHNNCIGCVKATSPGYWNRVREYFPEVFNKRCKQSRALGVKLVRIKGKREYLDKLVEGEGVGESDGEIECGPVCQGKLID